MRLNHLLMIVVAGIVALVGVGAGAYWWASRSFVETRPEPIASSRPLLLPLPVLLEGLSSEDPTERLAAVVGLEYYPDEAAETVPELKKLVKDSSVFVRQATADALGKLGEPAAPAVPELAALLSDEDNNVRRSAAVALGKIGPKASSSTGALQAAAKMDTDEAVRAAALEALRQVAPQVAAKLDQAAS